MAVFILVISVVLSAPGALAEKRVALVIGNSAYVHTPKLDNPKNDATDVAAALKKHGFQVFEGLDLSKSGMDSTIRAFAVALSAADVGVFFYAGHGLQVSGQNFLVPIDAQLTTASALEFEMVRLDLVHRVMEREARTNILFIDACRNNPLARNLARAMGTRSAEIGRGLAAIEAGAGTLISFSTQPGNVALDGTGRNSPFAGALVKHASTSHEDLGAILIAVRNDVMKETARKQVPWEHSALTGRVYFSPPRPAEPPRELQVELAFWASVKDSANPKVLGTYLERYPQGEFAPVARALIEQFERQEKAAQAAREETRKREDEARKAADVKRIEQEQRSGEAALAAERARAKDNGVELKRLEEQQRAELAARNEELQKAQAEARKARDDAKAAEAQRLAALKAAEQATKAAEDTIAKKREQEKSGEAAKLAALPKVEAPRSIGSFDGTWTVSWTSVSGCLAQNGTFRLPIANGTLGGKAQGGRLAASGAANWIMPAVTDGAPIRYQGTFRGNTGAGTFTRSDNTCNGTFTARRG